MEISSFADFLSKAFFSRIFYRFFLLADFKASWRIFSSKP